MTPKIVFIWKKIQDGLLKTPQIKMSSSHDLQKIHVALNLLLKRPLHSLITCLTKLTYL